MMELLVGLALVGFIRLIMLWADGTLGSALRGWRSDWQKRVKRPLGSSTGQTDSPPTARSLGAEELKTQAQAMTKLTKLFAMMASAPSNQHEAKAARERFDVLLKKHQLSLADLLSPDNPEQELVLSIVRERQRVAKRIWSLAQFAVQEWKRESEVSSRWAEKEAAKTNPSDFALNPATFRQAKDAAAEARELSDRHYIPLNTLGLDDESLQLLRHILDELALAETIKDSYKERDLQSSRAFEDDWN